MLMSAAPHRIVAVLAVLAVNVRCTGEISDALPGGPGPEVEQCVAGPLLPSATPLALLSPDQYLRSVRAVLADNAIQAELDPVAGDTLTQIATEKLAAAAEAIVARPSFATLRAGICGGRAPTACADDFIASFARRLFRRPASTEELAWLRDRFDKAATDLGADDALNVVAEIILQAPQTLYLRVDGIPGEGDLRFLDGYERAGRLAFFLWDGAPDDALLEAAAQGLGDDEALRAQVDRMLTDPRAREPMVQRFVDWLELDGSNLHTPLEQTRTNPDKFPADSESLRAAMRIETEALVERALFERDGSIDWLLNTRDAYVNGELADLYGVAHLAEDPATFVWTELPASERAGLFTRAAFLSLYANPNVQSPIKRGAFLVKRTLCVALGDPPPNVDDRPIEGGASPGVVTSTREAVTNKTKDASCSPCHAFLNPFGYALGTYDALGAFATSETVNASDGTPHQFSIDAAVTLPGGEAGLAVNGPVELSDYLANNEEVYQCFAKRWFGSAFARAPSRDEECALRVMGAELASSKRLGDFIVALVRSEAFTQTRVAEQP
ncbi:MAG TPA: DUF1592 domain-containing protein [Myxococcota bacterium]|nr:DUF1592 domain-containing protein [Myxococcota bacterium]